jgi:hypothetical protein
MDYSGPEPADFQNVRSLNRAFLCLVRDSTLGRRTRAQLPPQHRPAIRALTDLQIGRLSKTPFLLLSVREHDDDFWRRLMRADAGRSLFANEPPAREELRILSAALAFLWQLARRNPYAARLVCGGSLRWCRQLADCTLLKLLGDGGDCRELLTPRFADDESMWAKLLGPGLGSEREIRKAAQLSVLQSMLTRVPAAQYSNARSAACRSAVPSLQIAGKPGRS